MFHFLLGRWVRAEAAAVFAALLEPELFSVLLAAVAARALVTSLFFFAMTILHVERQPYDDSPFVPSPGSTSLGLRANVGGGSVDVWDFFKRKRKSGAPTDIPVLAEVARDMALNNVDAAALERLCRNGDILRRQGDLERSQIVLEFATANSIRVLGEDHTDTLGALYLMAETHRARGDMRSARELEEAYVAGLKRTIGPDHRDTLIAMQNLSETLRDEGNLSGAKAVGEEAFAAMQRTLGPDHADTSIAAMSLAYTLLDAGEPARALQMIEAVVVVKERTCGPDHPDTTQARDIRDLMVATAARKN